jgi:colanic acid/amylovoran biosynthesis glycosyltransferase
MPPDPRFETSFPPDIRAPLGFAYLFERFPSFSQTFCFREVSEMLAQGVEFPVFSIRLPKDEPDQVFPPEVSRVTHYLPQDFDAMLRSDPRGFGREVQTHQKILVDEWGGDSDRKRIHEALWLARVLRAAGVTHVHAHFAGMAARTAYWLKRFAGVKFSFTAHANDVFVDEPKARLPELFREAEFVATETDFSVQFIQEKFPQHAAKIHRVYNGIDAQRFAAERKPGVPPLIVSVGRYIEKKGFLDLIDACGALRELPFRCLLIGQGPMEEEMRARIARLDLDGRVEVAGTRNESEIAMILSEASIFVLACVKAGDGGSDNLPTVIMEAMAAGVPVVSTSTAGVPEMVVDGETGLLVEQKSPDALARAIRFFLENPADAERMGGVARSRCLERFDIHRTTETLRRLLSDHGAFRS